MQRICWILFLLLAGFGFSGDGAASDGIRPEDFHAPRTEAEKALGNLMRIDKDERSNVYSFLLNSPYEDHSQDAHYTRLFTKNFRHVISTREAEMVKKECGGKYREGEVCGFDYDLITCSQDVSDHDYLFYTLKDGNRKSVITYTWFEFLDDGGLIHGPRYTMTKDAEGWKLDGVACGPGRFNMR